MRFKDRFKNWKKLKRDTEVIIVSVALLTLTTIGVSYSVFFSIESQTSVQQITTGTLVVTIDNNNSFAMGNSDLMPTPTSMLPTAVNSSITSDYAKMTLNNSGTLPADFSVSISYDTLPSGHTAEELISMQYLLVGVYEENVGWVNFGSSQSPVYYTVISGLTPNSNNEYPILRSIINAASGNVATARQFRIYVWLHEDTPTSEIGKMVYLKLNVKSTTVNGQLS